MYFNTKNILKKQIAPNTKHAESGILIFKLFFFIKIITN